MSLNNVDSSSGELIAIGNDGDAVSTAYVADSSGDFSSIRNTSAKYEYENISEATVADTLITSSPIANGDNLVIVKDDDTIHEVVASGVTGVGPYSMDTTAITAGEIPSKVFTVDSKVSFDDGTGFTYPSELGNNYLAAANVSPTPDLTPGLIAHYLLNNNADDSHGTFDGSTVGTVDFQGDQADTSSGSITIPNSSAVSCSYWKDSGEGMEFTYTIAIPTSLVTDNYSNLRMYSDTKSALFQEALLAEGYYPKPLPLPTTEGLIAHYPLTGTAEDTTGNYDGVESNITYSPDVEFNSMLRSSSSNVVPSLVYNTTLLRTSTDATTISFSIRIHANNSSGTQFLIFAGSTNVTRFYIGASVNYMRLGIGYGEKQNVTTSTGIPFSWGELIHITAVFNNGTARLYKNAIEGFTDTYIPTLDTQRVASIGGYWSDNSFYDTVRSPLAYLSNYRVYNRELTVEEITNIYNYEKNFRPIDIDDGLVAYYPLAKNSLDNYHNEYDGADTNMTYDGLSAIFDRTGFIFTTATSSSTFSRSIWINPKAIKTSHLLSKYDGSDKIEQLYFSDTGTFKLDFGSVGGTRLQLESTTKSINTWYHVVVTYDGTIAKLFIDNVLEVSSTVVPTNWVDIAGLYIGRRTDSLPSGYADMEASKLRIYDKAISPEQIQIIYDTEKGDFVPEEPNPVFLTNTRQYDDIVVDGKTIETKIELKSIGDKCTEVAADIWKTP